MNRLNRLTVLSLAVLLVAVVWGQSAAASLAPTEAAAKLVQQVDVALNHASFALAAPNDQGFRTHTHHVVNILVGASGMGFDASFGNPGDGYGALEYARDLRASAEVATAGWQGAAQNIALWLERAAQEALRAAQAADRGEVMMARTPLIVAIGFLSAAKGRDGEQAPVAGGLSLLAGLPEAEEQVVDDGGYY